MIPDDHLVRKIGSLLDLSWVYAELAPYYSEIGRPSIDPELMIRMLIIGYVFAIRSERQICREVQVNLAYRWFCDLGRPRNQAGPTAIHILDHLHTRRRVVMIRPVVGAVAFGLLATTPAFAIAPNCADQLAQIKAEMTSDVLAQSELEKKYEEANRLCASGKDTQAQALARDIREEMANKHASPDARESAGSSVKGRSEAPKGSPVVCPDGKPAIVASGVYRCPRSE